MRVAIINLNRTKRDAAVARALEAGFRTYEDEIWMFSLNGPIEADDLESFEEKVAWAQLVCLIGHQDNQPIWRMFYRAGKDILLVDEAYMCKHRYWRFALNGWQSAWMFTTPYDPERLYKIISEAGIYLLPYNTAGRRSVTYAGVSYPFSVWHKLDGALEYDSGALRRTANALHEDVQRLITQVPYENVKGLWRGNKVYYAPNKVPLETCLSQSLALVSYAQPACVTAMIMGVPVIDLAPTGVGPVWPFVGSTEHLKCPAAPTNEDRIIALSRLAHNQFTLAEISSGWALQQILPHTVKRFDTLDGMSDAEHVIEQYRYMHQAPKMFRGGLAKAFVARIKALVEKYDAKTLLDYGSGKGRQYEESHQHQQWGDIKPTCYDPGHEPYSKKPTGYFDGVICTDVAEHVPPSGIEQFLLDVINYGRRFVFFCIFTDAAVKYLPDGRNVHLTIKPMGWWNDQIVKALVTINPQSHPSIVQESDDTFTIRNNGMEIVVFYRNKDTEKEGGK